MVEEENRREMKQRETSERLKECEGLDLPPLVLKMKRLIHERRNVGQVLEAKNDLSQQPEGLRPLSDNHMELNSAVN